MTQTTPQTMTHAAQADDYQLLIKQLLRTPLQNYATQEIVYADQRRLTYAEMGRRVHRLGHALAKLGVGHGTTVAVMDWDSHRYLECFFAVPMSAAVLQTVNVRLSVSQIAYTLNHAGAEVLLINSEFLPLLEQMRAELTSVRQFVLISDAGAALPDGFAGEYEALLAAAPASDFDFPDFDERTRATTFYTTGTTGNPKGVYFSHRQLVLHTLAVGMALGTAGTQGRFGRDDVYMPITPMFHVHAWGTPFVATVVGAKQVYPGRYVPDKLLDLIARERVTFSHCVPTILQMLLTSLKSETVDLRHWKVLIGGSALTTGLAKAARERGIDVYTGYGMSETCPILTIAHLDSTALGSEEELNLRVKTGRAIPLVNLRTVDGELHDCPRDGRTQGEVVVRAPWLTQGYLHDQAASDALWSCGWLHTQDIGHLDARGYLQVTDRIKDVIKTGGEWVSSLAIEEIIARHPQVLEVAVLGIKDPAWGERPIAVVVRKADAPTLDADTLRAHVLQAVQAGEISKFALPDRFEFVTQLQRTSVGKLNKRAMRELYTK